MQTTEDTPQTNTGRTREHAAGADKSFDQAFRPNGAIAFFVLLVILGLVIWYGIYFLMLQRM